MFDPPDLGDFGVCPKPDSAEHRVIMLVVAIVIVAIAGVRARAIGRMLTRASRPDPGL